MSEQHILNSWKDIAQYLGRGVRTVQRWERYLQLPVHRPAGRSRSAVVAFSDELDTWLNQSPTRELESGLGSLPSVANGQSNSTAGTLRVDKKHSSARRTQFHEIVVRTQILLGETAGLLKRTNELQTQMTEIVARSRMIKKQGSSAMTDI